MNYFNNDAIWGQTASDQKMYIRMTPNWRQKKNPPNFLPQI